MPTVVIHAMRFKRGTDRLLSRTRMTFSADLALKYVRELSADYRAGVILDARGAVLAGDERLASAAREIVSAAATGGPAGGGAATGGAAAGGAAESGAAAGGAAAHSAAAGGAATGG